MMRRWNFRGLAGVIFVAFFVASGILSSTASATGESYIYDKGILYATDAGNFFHIYAASFPNGNEKLQLISLGTQGYPKTSNMEVFYIERKPEHLAQQCGDATSYVEVHVDKSTKKTTVVKAACGRQSEQGTNPVFSGDFSSYNTWSQSVDVQWLGDAAPPPTGPVDITGVATYKFDTAASKSGEKIQACGGFFKQFSDSSDCVTFSRSSSSSDTATQPIVGTGSSHYYNADQSAGPCNLRLELAISAVDRQMQSGALPGHVGYRLYQGTTDVTSQSAADKAGCVLTRTEDPGKWEILPGLAITITGADELESFLDDPVETGPSAPSCTIDGIGWLICPVVNFLANIVDGAYGLVSNLLVFQGFTSGENGAMRSAWEGMRNIANIFFVIGFLVIVFSQLTSVGISNYGIKKLLPKLILTAILVNLSYTLCALAVDASNLVGSGIKDLFENFSYDAKPTGGPFSGEGWLGVAGGILAGTLITGTALYVGLSALLPALIAAIVSIVTAFLVLTLRQALLILLVVISPLAIVALLLPNTENWFKKWRSTFTTLLLIYPIIGLLFGASALASSIIMSSATGDAGVKVAIQIMGALAAILPLALTPILLKASGGILGRFGAFVNNPHKGPFDRMRKGAERIRKDAEGRRGIRALRGGAVIGAGRFRRKARREAVSEGIKREQKRAQSDYIAQQVSGNEEFRNRVAGGGRSSQLRADEDAMQRALDNAEFTIQQADVEEAKAASARIDRAVLTQNELRTVGAGGSITKIDSNGREQTFSGSNSSVRAAAWGKMAEQQDLQGLNATWDALRTSNDQESRKEFADILGSMQGRPAWFSQGALQGMRLGGNIGTADSLIDTAIDSNAYSAERIVKSDRGELALVADRANATGNTTNIQAAISVIDGDPQLSRAIDKNIRQIDALRTGAAGDWHVNTAGERNAR